MQKIRAWLCGRQREAPEVSKLMGALKLLLLQLG